MKRYIRAAEDWKEKHGIVEERPGLGFSESEQKWYGWSHRAFYGFGIGHVCKEGDVGVSKDGPIKPGFKCKSLADCKKVAEAFSDDID